MKKTMLKAMVVILTIAMLLQVPFALQVSASTLSESTTMDFEITGAKDAAGNIKAALFAKSAATEDIKTIGATLVIKIEDAQGNPIFDLVDKNGNVITDTYKVESRQFDTDANKTTHPFALYPCAVEDEETFSEMSACSLASYNSTTKEMYLFICGYSAEGLSIPNRTEIAYIYLKAADGVVPENGVNMRLMTASEFRDATKCPSAAIAPAEISSANIVFNPSASDIVSMDQQEDIEIDVIKTGKVYGTIASENNTATVTVTMSNAEHTYSGDYSGSNISYSFEEAVEGTYTITISAPGSLGYTINNVLVESQTPKTLQSVDIVFGDNTEDGKITLADLNNLISYISANQTVAVADVNGDNKITLYDFNMVINHYNMRAIDQTADAVYAS